MKETWLRILKKYDQDEYQRLRRVDTKGLVGGAIATYARNEKNEIVDQYAFEVIGRGGLTKEYLKNLFAMPYKSLLRPALLGMYRTYVPVTERVDLGLKTMDMMGKEFNWIK